MGFLNRILHEDLAFQATFVSRSLYPAIGQQVFLGVYTRLEIQYLSIPRPDPEGTPISTSALFGGHT